jgi:hypothetical protein
MGDGVEGPSIRFVEEAHRIMGNIVSAVCTLYDDENKRIVRVEVTDLEANLQHGQDITIEKCVERRYADQERTVIRQRLNKQGKLVYIVRATEDELQAKENALVSKAMRTEGLRLIPAALKE